MVEIMSPAGSFECLRAGIKAGADSVYFGVENLNMRSHGAENFEVSDLLEVVEICRASGVKSYLTVNSIIYDDDFEEMRQIVDAAKSFGVDAVIACDMAVIEYANSVGIEVHSSTQLNISNIEAVEFYSKYCDVVVLARELKLEQIKWICSEIISRDIRGPSGELVKVEIFCHGALCVSISGKCYMGLAVDGFSANRGKCSQPCRRKYRVIDEEGYELVIDNNYIMSPKDLCTLKFLDKILESGVGVLKIEGRARGADYVYTVTKVYREAVDCLEKGEDLINGKRTLEGVGGFGGGVFVGGGIGGFGGVGEISKGLDGGGRDVGSINGNSGKVRGFDGKVVGDFKKRIDDWVERLSKVFNRGFWHGGYYLGKELGGWSGSSGSQASHKKFLIGRVEHYFDKIGVAHLDVGEEIKSGDSLLITGPTTGIVEVEVREVFVDGEVGGVGKGENVSIKVGERVRENDRVWLVRKV